jgi:hypothetical protein
MATVYFFNGTQSGTADGSYADPYDLTQLATQESSSTSGDVFIFKDGTYTITSALTLGADGVTYRAENTGDVLFNHSGLNLGNSVGNYAGFNLKGIKFNGGGILGLRILDGDLLTVEECEFIGLISGYRTLVGDTGATDNGYGMNATFKSCIFEGTAHASEVRFLRYRLSTILHDLTLESCTLVLSSSVGGSGIFQTNQVGSFVIKNSILACSTSGASLYPPPLLTETNNCYYNIGESADPANNIIVDDPQFVDVTTGDFRLRPSSPCIGAGTVS